MPQVIHPSSTSFTHSNGVNFSYSPIFIISPGNLGGSASNESPNINTNEASLQRSSSRSNSLQFSENQKQDVTALQPPADTDKKSTASTPSISQNKKETKTKKDTKEDSMNQNHLCWIEG